MRDGAGATSTAASVTITAGNTAPSVSMTSPASGSTFAVGQVIRLTGSATDREDGTLPASRLRWNVLVHHGTHTHPLFSGTGNDLTFTAPAPEDLAATTTSYVEVRLTATDSAGASTTVRRNVQPRKVAITFATSPSGLAVVVNGTTVTGSTTVTSWQRYRLNVNAPSPQGRYVFSRWSDGGAQSHTIVTPATATTYTAFFAAAR